jgi:hypothetical protein
LLAGGHGGAAVIAWLSDSTAYVRGQAGSGKWEALAALPPRHVLAASTHRNGNSSFDNLSVAKFLSEEVREAGRTRSLLRIGSFWRQFIF